jgi:hypothetical protein
MPSHRAHRCWTLAYSASWMLAVGSAAGLLGTVVGTIYGTRVVETDGGLVGIAIGIALGFVGARSTVRRHGLHRGLVVGGALAAAAGTAGAWVMIGAARSARGDGPFVGLGDALSGLLLACVAVIGLACLAAGATGRLAARTAPTS